MRAYGVQQGAPCRWSDPPPGGGAAWSVSLGALSALLAAVVAGSAQALQVALVPEKDLIAVMLPLVVDDEHRRVGSHEPAPGPLAGEHVAGQDDHAHSPPARRLVELAPRRVQDAVLVAGALYRR